MVAINPHKVPFVGKFAQSMRSLRREDERGLLYRMEYDADYYTLLPVMDLVANAGCSTFVAKTPDGGVKMGRNFDLRHYRNNIETSCADMTGLIVAVHTANPRAKYASVGIADAFWLDAKHGSFYEGVPEDGKTDISGIYAAGDVRTKELRQVVTAVADGANCVTSIQRYLQRY